MRLGLEWLLVWLMAASLLCAGWRVGEAGSESVLVRGGQGCEQWGADILCWAAGLGWLVAPLHSETGGQARPVTAPHQLKWSIKTDGNNAINFYTSSEFDWLSLSKSSEYDLIMLERSKIGVSWKFPVSQQTSDLWRRSLRVIKIRRDIQLFLWVLWISDLVSQVPPETIASKNVKREILF